MSRLQNKMTPAEQRKFERMRARKRMGEDFMSEIKQCVEKTNFLASPKSAAKKKVVKKKVEKPVDDIDDNYPHVKFVIRPRIARKPPRTQQQEPHQVKTMSPQIENEQYERRGNKPSAKDQSSSAIDTVERFSLAEKDEVNLSTDSFGYSDKLDAESTDQITQDEEPKPRSDISEFEENVKQSETDKEQYNWRPHNQVDISDSSDEPRPLPEELIEQPEEEEEVIDDSIPVEDTKLSSEGPGNNSDTEQMPKNPFLSSTDDDSVPEPEPEPVPYDSPNKEQSITEYIKNLSKQFETEEEEEDRNSFHFSSSDTENTEITSPVPEKDDSRDAFPVCAGDDEVDHSFTFSTPPAGQHQIDNDDDEEDSDSGFDNGNQFLDSGNDTSSSEEFEVVVSMDTREEEIRQNRRKDRLIYASHDTN